MRELTTPDNASSRATASDTRPQSKGSTEKEALRASPTPGPWRLFSSDGEYSRYPDGGLSTNVYPSDSDKYEHRIASGIHLDNARLIAAAPDLLEALKAITERHAWQPELGPCVCDQHRAANAAIAKAEGGVS